MTEVMLYEITDSRAASEYAVYRIKGMERAEPMMRYALSSAYGSPFDDLMLFGNGCFCGAELPFEAALTEGHTLAAPRRLGDFTDADSPLAQHILSRWQDHPYCVDALSAGDCWPVLTQIAIVTPATLIVSDKLERVWR